MVPGQHDLCTLQQNGSGQDMCGPEKKPLHSTKPG
jgi:hypothetical protein